MRSLSRYTSHERPGHGDIFNKDTKTSMLRNLRAIVSAVALPAVIASAGCEAPEAPKPPPPTPVRVATVESRDVPIFREYIGELVPAREVELHARVGGILLEQHVPDGARVHEGQRLFSIDTRDARERREAAQADLAAAEAEFARARSDVERYQPLLADEAIARQVYDNAVAALEAAKAGVEARTALLRQAELAIEYADILSPLDGRMGAAEVTVGDLISAGVTTLATVTADDPLWVYFSPSETELLAFSRRRAEQPALAERLARSATLLLSDGQVYPEPGVVNFSDRVLDARTGTYRVRVEFPNPESRLLPGQFVRVRLQTNLYEGVTLVPARAVIEVLDQAFVGIVAADGTFEQRPVTLGPRIETDWIVESGVRPGETIVVEGAQKVRPGMPIQPLSDESPKETESASAAWPVKGTPRTPGAGFRVEPTRQAVAPEGGNRTAAAG